MLLPIPITIPIHAYTLRADPKTQNCYSEPCIPNNQSSFRSWKPS